MHIGDQTMYHDGVIRLPFSEVLVVLKNLALVNKDAYFCNFIFLFGGKRQCLHFFFVYEKSLHFYSKMKMPAFDFWW